MSCPPRSKQRRTYIDVARGLAVLLMIEAHTTDAWTRAASKTTVAFRNATILGGFAAPLFLWLAGVGVAMSAARVLRRTARRADVVEGVARRGLEIFLLAFLFRFQAFVVSPGGPAIMLFRVDILNIMGPAIAFAGMLWLIGDGPRSRAIVFAIAATAIALVTPIVRAAAFVDALPVWVQWYIRPAGEHTTFTAFPWIGFVFAGAACGALIADADDDAFENRLQVRLGIAGAAIVVMGLATASLPTIYRSSSFWTSSPTWFAIRVGVLMITLAALKGCATVVTSSGTDVAQPFRAATLLRVAQPFRAATLLRVAQPFRAATLLRVAQPFRGAIVYAFAGFIDALARMGRASLFIYWIHVELVYGYASWLWRGRLPLPATVVGYAAFSALMYGAVVLRDRVTIAWRTRQAVAESTTA